MANAFFKGVLVGAVATLAVVQLRKRGSPGRRRSSDWQTHVPQKEDATRIHLKRDDNAGDPSALTAARTGVTAGFERSGGAPGGSGRAESAEVPGHPGSELDYTDPHQPVKPASRTLNLREMPERSK